MDEDNGFTASRLEDRSLAASQRREGRLHELKTWAPYWDAVATGEKTFEVRRDDRGFQKGDMLALHRMRFDQPHRYDDAGGDTHLITKRTIYKRITYVLTGGQLGIEPGYVVLGLERSSLRDEVASEPPPSGEAVTPESATPKSSEAAE